MSFFTVVVKVRVRGVEVYKRRTTAAVLPTTTSQTCLGAVPSSNLNLTTRVLSGTKYGVKQTRGKFGLGSKMVAERVRGFLTCVGAHLVENVDGTAAGGAHVARQCDVVLQTRHQPQVELPKHYRARARAWRRDVARDGNSRDDRRKLDHISRCSISCEMTL